MNKNLKGRRLLAVLLMSSMILSDSVSRSAIVYGAENEELEVLDEDLLNKEPFSYGFYVSFQAFSGFSLFLF